MVKFLRKLPAGLFLVPLVLSIIVYTIAPDLMMTGGMVQSLFSGEGIGFMVAALTFYSGTLLNIQRLVRVLKRHGVILLVKAIVSVILSFAYIYFFGQEGVLGISAVAFVVAVSSTNPAIYMSIVESYGNDDDPTAFGLTGMFSIPLFPIFVFSLVVGSAGGGMDWTPLITTLIPLISVAGVSVSTPAVLGRLYPELVGTYVVDATSQLMLVCVITSILAPIISQWQYRRVYGTTLLGDLTDQK